MHGYIATLILLIAVASGAAYAGTTAPMQFSKYRALSRIEVRNGAEVFVAPNVPEVVFVGRPMYFAVSACDRDSVKIANAKFVIVPCREMLAQLRQNDRVFLDVVVEDRMLSQRVRYQAIFAFNGNVNYFPVSEFTGRASVRYAAFLEASVTNAKLKIVARPEGLVTPMTGKNGEKLMRVKEYFEIVSVKIVK